LGLSTVLSNGVRLHAAANRRSRFPALRELYSGALNRFEPNPDLKPERFAGLEAGATMFASAQLQGVFQQPAFRRHSADHAARREVPAYQPRSAQSTGIELLETGAARRSHWGGPDDSARAGLDPAVTGTSRRPENVPELGAGANIDVKFGESLATMALNYKGAQYCLHPDLGQNVKLRARTSTDASLARELTVRRTGLLSRLRAVLAIDNAFDTAIYDQCGLPEPGRTIRLGMSLR
jgi:iron complex outermembrane receptor protein